MKKSQPVEEPPHGGTVTQTVVPSLHETEIDIVCQVLSVALGDPESSNNDWNNFLSGLKKLVETNPVVDGVA